MNVVLEGKRVTLDDSMLLGEGGEARVYRLGPRALKVFHTPGADKARKLAAFPRGLPRHVVSPEALLFDGRGRVVGYAMAALDAATDAIRLSQRRFREGIVSSQDVTAIFRHAWLTLCALHHAGVVVGDLNDGNVLWRNKEAFFIDADSMQITGFPCTVAHERFLDPRLYGVDLAKAAALSAGSDWFAFAVLLFQSLLYVHPYGGIHPAYPTLLRRAEARVSVLGEGVTLPKAAVSPRVLPDALCHWFSQVFDRDERGPMPAELLETLRWHRCACGLEHARPACPDCASTHGVVVELLRHHGRCRARRIFHTPGRLLAARVQRGLRYAYEEAGVVRREDASLVFSGALTPELHLALAEDSTWLGLGEKLVRVERGQPVERAETARAPLGPGFAAAQHTLFRIEADWLVDHATGERLGRVAGGRTMVACGSSLGLCLWRAGHAAFASLFAPGRAGLREVRLPISGRIVDLDVVFDQRHALLSLHLEHAGARTAAVFLLDDAGRIVGRRTGRPDESPILAACAGKALLGGRALLATDEGLVALRVDAPTGTLVEGTLYADTRPFVAAGVDLLPGPSGSVYVVTTRDITQLELA